MASAGAQREPPESFSRSRAASDTLSRLPHFIAKAETKQPARNQREDTPHLPMYACPECGKGFTYVTDMLNHQEVEHALPKPHRCPSSGKAFSLRSSLQLHQCDGNSSPCELCHGESRLGSPCPECRTRTSDLDSLQDKSLHRQPYVLCSTLYPCAPCGRGFSHIQALLQHRQAGCSESLSRSEEADAISLPDDSPPPSEGELSHSDSSKAPGPSSRGVGVSRFCSRSLHTEDGPQHHKQDSCTEGTQGEHVGGETRTVGDVHVNREPKTKQKSKKKFLSCRSCAMVFRSTTRLYMHRQEKHSRENSTVSEPWPVRRLRKQCRHPCPICSKVFFHHMSLRSHLRQHTAASLAKNIEQPVGRDAKHENISEKRPNEAKSSLADGKTVKAGPGRPSKVFRSEAKVSDQGRDETEEEEEMEFPCPSCAEVFSLQWQLRDHVELHQSSVKMTQCSVCTHEMNMCKLPGSKRHRPYHCVPCQQSFSAIDSFLEHCQEHLRARVEEDCLMEGYAQQAGKARESL